MIYSYGTNLIGVPPEALQPVAVAELVEIIRQEPALQHQTAELRQIRSLDVQAYKRIKTRLPYVVSGEFRDGIRRNDCFIQTTSWIIDLDDCLSSRPATLRKQLTELPFVQAVFTSPSGQGLKVFVALDEPCTQVADFSEAYQQFARELAERIQLVGSLDMRTHDPARACFLAHDPDVYFQPQPQGIQWRRYLLPKENTLVVKEKSESLPEDTYQHIRQLVNPQAIRKAPAAERHVPALLHELKPSLVAALQAHQWTVEQVIALQYGLKFCIRNGLQTAEANVFYGKRGFSLVPSPKTGTSPELAQQLHQVLEEMLFHNTEGH